MPKQKVVIIPHDRFRDFLVRLVSDERVADEIIKNTVSEIVELAPGDKLVRFSDVQDALRKVGS